MWEIITTFLNRKVLYIDKKYSIVVINMKFNECKECKSKNMLITSDLNGNVFGAVCLTCGWEFESPSFKKIYSEIDDVFKDFDRESILKTKRKKLV